MSATEPLDYDELHAVLARLALGIDASELHGALCGFLAAGGVIGQRPLLAVLEIEVDSVVAEAEWGVWQRLAVQAEQSLADSELGFEPLIPDEERPLDERVEALVDWSRGFLCGLGLAGTKAYERLTEDGQEILQDFRVIAATDFDFGDNEEDEDALAELHEFVRMGAVLLYAEGHAMPAVLNSTLH